MMQDMHTIGAVIMPADMPITARIIMAGTIDSGISITATEVAVITVATMATGVVTMVVTEVAITGMTTMATTGTKY